MPIALRSILALAVIGFATTAEAAGTWSAFALDYRGGYGTAVGVDSEAEAKKVALDECGNRACEVIFTAEADCVAVADNRSDGYWYGYAYGKTQAGTEMIALGYCLENEKGECRPLGSACVNSRPVGSDDGGKNKL